MESQDKEVQTTEENLTEETPPTPPKRRRKREHKPEATGLTDTTPSMRGAGKYAKKPKVGKKDHIGRSPNYVSSVGLGKLKVISAHGYNER